jgi:hypothetical protein
VFPFEMQVYWSRLEGKGLRDSFLLQLQANLKEALDTIERDLESVDLKAGDINATYRFSALSKMDEIDLPVPLALNEGQEKDLMEALVLEDEDVKAGEILKSGGKDN